MGQDPDSQSMLLNKSPDAASAVTTKTVKRYTKEFLLSFFELESCKKLPTSIDPQIQRSNVSEGVNAVSTSSRGLIRRERDGDAGRGEPLNVPEWRRAPGSNWAENGQPRGNYDRTARQIIGNQGRCDYRSGGNEREKDHLRQERGMVEQDLGRQIHSNNHHGRQGPTPQHDGILGSGSSSKSSRSSGAAMVPHPRGHDRHASGRNYHQNDAYHMHRASKINIHPRHETTDRYNDETFGSNDISTEERMEHERKRRDSFEMMRKEHHRLHIEKQKLNASKQAQEHLGHSSKKKPASTLVEEEHDQLEEHSAILPLPHQALPIPKVNLSRASTSVTSRPLVPPGFSLSGRKGMEPKNVESNVDVQSVGLVVCNDNTKIEVSLDGDAVPMKEGQSVIADSRMYNCESEVPIQDNSITEMPPGNRNMLPEISSIASVCQTQESITGIDGEHWASGNDNTTCGNRIDELEARSKCMEDKSESILDRLFGNASASLDKPEISDKDQPEDFEQNSKRTPKSSKFARWFHMKEEESSIDMSEQGASNILSLFTKKENNVVDFSSSEEYVEKGDKTRSSFESIFSFHTPGKAIPMPLGPSLEDIEKGMAASVEESTRDGTSGSSVIENDKSTSIDIVYNNDISDLLKKVEHKHSSSSRLPGNILTCEDLEQSIIAEASEHVSKLQIDSEENHVVSDVPGFLNEPNEADCNASEHLLSLFQKGLKSNYTNLYDSQDHNKPVDSIDDATQNDDIRNAEASVVSDKSGAHTLELLFGNAFMKKLRLADASASVKTPDKGSNLSQHTVTEDVSCMAPELMQKSLDFTDSKEGHEDNCTGSPHRPLLPAADTSNLSSNGGIEHLLGMFPKQNSHVSQQQLMGPMDIPFNPNSLSGMHARPPPFLPFHHPPGPGNLNVNMNVAPPSQVNLQQASQNQQMFSHGHPLGPPHVNSKAWSDHSFGRSFPREPSAQVLYSLHHGPHPNQTLYQPLQPHGFAPSHTLQLPPRAPPLNNFPFLPEQVQHGPQVLPSPSYVHPPRAHIPEVPINAFQTQLLHPTPPNHSMRPGHAPSRDFNIPDDVHQNVGGMGRDGVTPDMLFPKELSRQPSGQAHLNHFASQNMGYG
eukprot:TRINITY_DN2179_c0_g1_i1.p1 TRINITY_DN2179_c0_g1~~TRINITY_DN2179_c0_g1_i1.p1  ORF type:complete len:1108 (-),score=279.40 TRINITY_DN2179_c0_g1_i1:98-3421(-)